MCVVGVVTGVWCVVGGVWFQLCAICSGVWCGVVWCGSMRCLVWGVLCVVQSVCRVQHTKCTLGTVRDIHHMRFITIFRHRVYSHAAVTPSVSSILILFYSAAIWLNSLG